MRLTLAASPWPPLPLLLAAAACAPVDELDRRRRHAVDRVELLRGTRAGDLRAGQLALKKPGTLTIGTDSPAYEPWFADNDPTNGKGFESAVAYAVAKQLGFTDDQVTWVKVPFNNSYAPGREELRLRHQPDLDHARRGPRWSTSPTATTPRPRASSR